MSYNPHFKQLAETPSGIHVEVLYENCFTTINDITHDEQHIHDSYELYVNLAGDVSFLVENNLYPIKRGDMVLTAPNDIHRCIYHSDCVHEHFCIWLKDIPFSSSALKTEFDSNKLVILSEKNKQNLIDLCFALYESYNGGDALRFRAVSSLASILDLICNHRKNVTPIEEPLPESFLRIVDYIIANFTNPSCNVTMLCKEFYISKSTLCRKFQQYFQMPPSDYIESKRFSEAKKLLTAGLSVQDTCFKSGFSDCSHFILQFRKKFGITPYKYQKTLK